MTETGILDAFAVSAPLRLDPYNAQPSYRFKPLAEESHFRVLRLCSQRGDSKISVTLHEKDLTKYWHNTSSGYVALSYEWAEPENRRDILIGGQPYYVRRNLYDYLCAARDCGWLNDKLIFIDAICIDQNNLDEREEQVSYMPEIFSYAEQVCVWLGPASDDVERLFDVYRRLGDGPIPCSKYGHHVSVFDAFDKNHFGDDYRPTEFLHSARACVQRTYWRRIWIVTEIHHARDIRVFCGHASISAGPHFCHIERDIEDIARHQQQPQDPPYWHGLGELLIPFYQPHSSADKIPAYHFAGLLQQHIRRQCTDPRDIVYALRTMISGRDEPSHRRDGTGLWNCYHRSCLWLFLRVIARTPSEQILRLGPRLRIALHLTDHISCDPVTQDVLRDSDMAIDELQAPTFTIFLQRLVVLGNSARDIKPAGSFVRFDLIRYAESHLHVTYACECTEMPMQIIKASVYTRPEAHADHYIGLGPCLGVGLMLSTSIVKKDDSGILRSYVLTGFGVAVPKDVCQVPEEIEKRLRVLYCLSLATYMGQEVFRGYERYEDGPPKITINWLDMLHLTTPFDAKASLKEMTPTCKSAFSGCFSGHWSTVDGMDDMKAWLD